MVPTPSGVNTSSRTACATRPSITVASPTPPRTARRQASIFGTIPDSSSGSMASTSAAVTSDSREDRSGQFAYRPSISVRTTSLSAPSAPARAAAAVSALTLSTLPSSSGATLATTGIRPASMRSSTAAGSTSSTSPTSPTSISSPATTAARCRARSNPPSSPDNPTAKGPCALTSPTSSRPTCPTSTIRTTSMVSGLVTRRPPRNSEAIPSRSSIAEIWGPPPCTTTGFSPADRRNTMSWANACLSSSSTMAFPPYLTTMIAS